jgi:hypothetical protein
MKLLNVSAGVLDLRPYNVLFRSPHTFFLQYDLEKVDNSC